MHPVSLAYLAGTIDILCKDLLEEVEDYVAPEVSVETKDWLTTFLLCLFCGGLGVHRYYVGKIGTGILYTLTAGLFGIGYLVDFIKILCGKFTDKNGNLIQREKK